MSQVLEGISFQPGDYTVVKGNSSSLVCRVIKTKGTTIVHEVLYSKIRVERHVDEVRHATWLERERDSRHE